MDFIERMNEKEQRIREQEAFIEAFFAWFGFFSLVFWACYLVFLWGCLA